MLICDFGAEREAFRALMCLFVNEACKKWKGDTQTNVISSQDFSESCLL